MPTPEGLKQEQIKQEQILNSCQEKPEVLKQEQIRAPRVKETTTRKRP
jgi:hypothetical protein